MSNTPQQQAELYRKAAETIEMCAKHGVEPKVKHCGVLGFLKDWSFNGDNDRYEFPISVIEGQLVWSDTVVYNALGRAITARHMKVGFDYTLVEPKQSLCEVEGKPVYKGDKLWCIRVFVREVEAESCEVDGFLRVTDGGRIILKWLSWNPPKRTVMVELTVEDAELHSNIYTRLGLACSKAINVYK